MSIGDRIKLIRKKNNLNQSQFASVLGISQTHISKIESNRDIPSDKILRTIGIEFSINFEWLKTGTGEDTIQTDSKEILLKDSVRDIKLYLDNCTDIEFMTFSSALLKLLNIWIMAGKEEINKNDKFIILSDLLTTIESGIEYLTKETKKISESGIDSKIDEIFYVTDKYSNKLSEDFEIIKNIYLGNGK
ncbi:MAG: helix-turn-helix transcriptional regulator [Oscillospiraceae bacterium]|nr:helix-turn-helix transcriptional regulator [Oscillospiraceae bacterium]